MGFGQTALIFSLILSVVLTVSGAPKLIENDALTMLFDTADQNNTKVSDAAFNSLPQSPESTSTQAGNNFGFTDGLKLIFGFVALLINILGAPAVLLTYMGLPMELVYLIGVPVMLTQLIGIVALVRGSVSW